MLNTVLQLYNIAFEDCTIIPLASGLINNTWKLDCESKSYILQRINSNVFVHPEEIGSNIEKLADFFSKNEASYLFTNAIKTVAGKNMAVDEGGNYFRLFHFITGSQTINAVKNKEQAFEAAKQFGKFTKLLADFPLQELYTTLPHFHNLSMRYKSFETAMQNAAPERLSAVLDMSSFIISQKNIAKDYEKLKLNPNFKLRVTHHDTKINNVLFNDACKGICVIDLDTVMPGYFISDVGDMIRTYTCEADENETDLSKIKIRESYFEALAKGYLTEMKNNLTTDEINAFVYAGKFLIYMQALRFLTDYLNNDIYYGAKYPLQNFDRAANQIALLKDLLSKEDTLIEIVQQAASTI